MDHANAVEAKQIEAIFMNPPREYSTAPLWVWNDMLTAEQIVSTLQDLAGQKVKQVFVHPRPGLMTPYLSEDWFRLWKVALQEAEKLDMNVWIYDENSYPSGFAGGLVPEAMPESRGKGIHFVETSSPPKPNKDRQCLRERNRKNQIRPSLNRSKIPCCLNQVRPHGRMVRWKILRRFAKTRRN